MRTNDFILCADGVMVACMLAFAVFGNEAHAAPAGVYISNTAHMKATVEGGIVNLTSNTVNAQLGELLNLQIAPTGGAEDVTPGETGHVSAFTLTNSGNGADAYAIASYTSGSQATLQSVWVDSNNNGKFDAGDTRIDSSHANVPLASGAHATLFAVSDIAADFTAGSDQISMTATSTTGSGTPGAIIPRAGLNGADAVVGESTGNATASVDLVADAGPARDVTLTKSQSVSNPNGQATGSGSIITYTLQAHISGANAVTDAAITDTVPAGTTYKPGTLTLDGVALSDKADTDAGTFDAQSQGLSVALGNITAAATHTVTFQVIIN